MEVHRIELLNGSKEFCQEFLSDVRIPDSNRVGDVDDGWSVGTRWMVHERMLMQSPLVTLPEGRSASGVDSVLMWSIAREAGRADDPTIRELIGEARMLDLVNREVHGRIREGMLTGAMSDQAAAISRLLTATAGVRKYTIAFDIAGAAGAAWSDADGQLAERGNDFLLRQVSCIGGGTTEMARNVISERVLGMPRERTLDRDVPFRDVPRGASQRR